MGTYLSTPVLEKGQESGETVDVSWGVVDMQGWRKTMEDAHVAATDIPQYEAKLFGVFDGHGGPEVARFCQLYMVDVWCKQMHSLTAAAAPGATPTHTTEESPEQESETQPESETAQSLVGQALIQTFHALDRMIDDLNRRNELIALRTSKPEYTERRTTDSILIPPIPEVYPTTQIADPAESKMEEETPKEDDDTDEQVGRADQDHIAGQPNGEDFDIDDEIENEPLTRDMTFVFQQILALNAPSGQLEINVVTDSEATLKDTQTTPQVAPPPPPTSPAAAPARKFIASITQNGRQICNLPDHAIHAGCTAIVAVLLGRTLTVANAGDSRAVLCHASGVVEPLSSDHKPQQDREMSRITKAGGFVNQFGRVNGNLNLSRCIGDLKYKQVPGISPAEQMITAEPDIVQVQLNGTEEFIVLGCDGIWDCLTNEQAVNYVRDRIDTKTPVEIGIELLDTIISADPKVTQGIGGDNMTVMVIDLLPHSRSYR